MPPLLHGHNAVIRKFCIFDLMKKFFAFLLLSCTCLGWTWASAYPAPAQRKGYSVLSLGQTLKISVQEEGIYKVSYEDLQQHGLIHQAVASSKVALYGNAAGVLPFINSANIYDDLSPLPIEMHDGGDDNFGPGDYFLFYGQSPHRWTYQAASSEFAYTRHYFCDAAFYFVSLNAELEHRVQTVSSTENEGENLTWFYEHIRHEKDLVNLCHGGLDWLGESFSFSGNNLSLSLATPDPMSGMNATLYVGTAARTTDGTATFRISFNQKSFSIVHPVLESGLAYKPVSVEESVQVSGNTSTLNLSFSKTGNTENGYLDYVSLVYPRRLRLQGASLFFRHPSAMNDPAQFSLEASPSSKIWDITDVYHINDLTPRAESEKLVFGTSPDSTLHEYVAFNPSLCPSPAFVGLVPVQNLHQQTNIDYVVVTHPSFLTQAQQVARLHQERDGYTVCVATTDEVYNEFSSGAKDPSAIRLFLRHLSIRSDAAHAPRHLLLFGDASYDYKNILGRQTDFVPTFQTRGLSAEGADDPLEDLFGYLSDDAGIGKMSSGAFTLIGKPQVAVGRLPVRNTEEADNMLKKIDIYSARNHVSDPKQPALSGNFGNWRNEVVFVSDDGFEKDVEGDVLFHDNIQNNFPDIHINKLYSDAYERSLTSTTTKVPALENALRNFVENGCLFLGYTGHSGWDAWSDEKILTNNIINNWKTSFSFPVIFASSCTFAFFDQTDKTSGAEYSVLRPHGGAIASIASARTAYTGQIEAVQRLFVETFIKKTNGKASTIGEALLYAKNNSLQGNTQKFVLLGDPGLRAALPQNKVQTLFISTDTLKALSPVTIEGRVTNFNDEPMPDFNGKLLVKVYDKATTKQTLGLYNAQEKRHNPQVNYTDQNSLIFQGETEVKDGTFRFSFIVPKDIQYNYGKGRISYYAYNDITDANGSHEDFLIGGMNPDAVIDDAAPVVNLYIGKNTFWGGTVGANPSLYAEISDEYGINTTGAGIGHDMTLIIDNDYKNAIVMNDFFRYNTGSYKTGSLVYPLELAPGKHTLRLKVWNINNISATQEISFTIDDSERTKMFDLKVLPNPVRGDHADFYFNHNSQNGGIQKCTLNIFDIQGAPVTSLEYTLDDLSGYTVGPLRWNLRTRLNQRVLPGVYICHITAIDGKGQTVERSIKLVVVN